VFGIFKELSVPEITLTGGVSRGVLKDMKFAYKVGACEMLTLF
jgi:hypothetical protein